MYVCILYVCICMYCMYMYVYYIVSHMKVCVLTNLVSFLSFSYINCSEK